MSEHDLHSPLPFGTSRDGSDIQPRPWLDSSKVRKITPRAPPPIRSSVQAWPGAESAPSASLSTSAPPGRQHDGRLHTNSRPSQTAWPSRLDPSSAGVHGARRGTPSAIGAAITKPVSSPSGGVRERGDVRARHPNPSPTQDHFAPGSLSPLPDARPSPSGTSRASAYSRPSREYWEEEYYQASPTTPSHPARSHPLRRSSSFTGTAPASRQPTRSVSGAPDHPLPGSLPSRRNSNAPPPGARRGYSSYYSQYSYVAPIPEESFEMQRSHGSYASSRVIPLSWGSVPSDHTPSPQFRLTGEKHPGAGGKSEGGQGRGGWEGTGFQDTLSAAFIDIHLDDAPLAHTPSSDSSSVSAEAESVRGPLGRVSPEEAQPTGWPGGAGTAVVGSDDAKVWDHDEPSLPLRTYQSAESMIRTPLVSSISNEALMAPVQSHSAVRVLNITKPAPVYHGSQKGVLSSASSQSQAVSPLEAFFPGHAVPVQSPTHFRRASDPDVESRNSLTSLPELIRRATRLATVLDVRRPKSSLQPLSFPDEGDAKHRGNPAGNRPGSISEILAYFPSPRGSSRPQGTGTPSPLTLSPHVQGSLKQARRRRRCCGLPAWVFIVFLASAMLLVTAAVVLPVVFIVLPRQRQAGATTAAGGCPTDFQCLNGGLNVADVGRCRCICLSGFSGDTCATLEPTDCATVSIPNNGGADLSGVTIGTAIPRLLGQASSAFGISLNPGKVVALFSSLSLSCTSENALVTFNGVALPASSAVSAPAPTRIAPRAAALVISAVASGETGSFLVAALATDAGSTVVPAASTLTVTGLGIPLATATATATATTTATATNPTATFTVTGQVLDLARVSVLFVLQQTTLDKAVAAQQSLQRFFDNPRAVGNVNLGNGMGVDLERGTFLFVNGTMVGGRM
ncbi:MAG: hypothetical protein M1826_002919 [Phylliscum demangeonii]|nr:MAG: hypothetical protein M1826_002919 [Phylliscum demangeonii]